MWTYRREQKEFCMMIPIWRKKWHSWATTEFSHSFLSISIASSLQTEAHNTASGSNCQLQAFMKRGEWYRLTRRRTSSWLTTYNNSSEGVELQSSLHESTEEDTSQKCLLKLLIIWSCIQTSMKPAEIVPYFPHLVSNLHEMLKEFISLGQNYMRHTWYIIS